MNLKALIFIILSLLVLMVLSQQDPKAVQAKNANTGSPAAAFEGHGKPTNLGCIPYCAEQPVPTLVCLVKCIKT
ncbi:predicted protein [Lichtheimia corymbifera JMRC:FSU:9682]|uniref:Uncharacterized protein n=1 Tax=Lichtheimia corymbifera JMRC:FSU:9682 TaxID=1263082 RepID=A0A068RYZ1_9FUNG|nr:predicted protein [Lichtheimia corymbifera JMRC:FSU:9682]